MRERDRQTDRQTEKERKSDKDSKRYFHYTLFFMAYYYEMFPFVY